MLEKLTHDDLLRLTSVQDGPCVSIYIPWMPAKTLSIEYEALIRRASHLLSFDSREDLKSKLLETLFSFNPTEYLKSKDQGLALFANKHTSGYFVTNHTLPSKAVVSETFHLKPLVDELQGSHTFHILVLSAEESLFLHCDGGTGTETHMFLFHQGQHSSSIHWKHLDESETAQIPHLKSHARGRGLQDNQFKKKTSIKIFLRWIEAKISKEPGYKSLPLFVFTNELLFQAYKEVSSHSSPSLCLVDTNKGLPRVESMIHQAQLIMQNRNLKNKNLSTLEMEHMARKKQVIDDLVKISRAALKGSVKTLFIRDNIDIWGEINRKNGQITFHEKQLNSKDDDILDDIACEVIRHGGEVIVLTGKDMPTNAPAAAILGS